MKFDRYAFAAQGLSIARAIKAELPNWTVVYFDEAAFANRLHELTRPRETFEYEVAQSNSARETAIRCQLTTAAL